MSGVPRPTGAPDLDALAAAPPSGMSLTGDRPGAAAAVTALHMRIYSPPRAQGGWNFGARFEQGVADGLGGFLAAHDPNRDLFLCIWTAEGALAGSLTLDARPAPRSAELGDARLRFFVVAPETQGAGLGRILLDAALKRARAIVARSVWLDTFAGLDAARRLYDRAGFVQIAEEASDAYGPVVRQQRLRLVF
ncbi:MAG: GNAT family N-acetyltransferase [Pseudomonadota bacterium]